MRGKKTNNRIVPNTVINICCSAFDTNYDHAIDFVFPKKIFSYLPSSIKTVDIRMNVQAFVRIGNNNYVNLPNKIKILSMNSYPGIEWREKSRFNPKMILIINFKCLNERNASAQEEIIGYSKFKTYITLMKYNYYDKINENYKRITFAIKEENKNLLMYDEKHYIKTKKDTDITIKEIC